MFPGGVGLPGSWGASEPREPVNGLRDSCVTQATGSSLAPAEPKAVSTACVSCGGVGPRSLGRGQLDRGSERSPHQGVLSPGGLPSQALGGSEPRTWQKGDPPWILAGSHLWFWGWRATQAKAQHLLRPPAHPGPHRGTRGAPTIGRAPKTAPWEGLPRHSSSTRLPWADLLAPGSSCEAPFVL